MNGRAMAVGVYLRVSTEEQRERQSIATQRDFADWYFSLHGPLTSIFYADDGVSGTIPLESRPAGSRMLRDAPSQEVRSDLSLQTGSPGQRHSVDPERGRRTRKMRCDCA
jgi:hypothetical protein